LNAGNTVINDVGLQKAALGLIPTSTQGVPASATIPNLVSAVKANPSKYLLIGAAIAVGSFFLIKRK